jgi:Cu/Ag efflux protein CusF
MMKLNTAFVALMLALGLVPLAAQAQPAPDTQAGVATVPGKAAGAVTAEITAKVTSVDPATRSVTLQGAGGKTRTIQVGDQVRNFDQIKVGDTVHAKYTQALALELKKGAASMGAPTEESAITPPPAPGAKPGGTIGRKVTAMTEVVAVDPAKQMVTLRGPEGNEVDVDVQDPNQLKNIKKGDHVQVTYVEALAIAVAEEPTKR